MVRAMPGSSEDPLPWEKVAAVYLDMQWVDMYRLQLHYFNIEMTCDRL